MVIKNKTKRMGEWQRQLCSLCCPSSCEFFGVAKGFGLRGFGQALEVKHAQSNCGVEVCVPPPYLDIQPTQHVYNQHHVCIVWVGGYDN